MSWGKPGENSSQYSSPSWFFVAGGGEVATLGWNGSETITLCLSFLCQGRVLPEFAQRQVPSLQLLSSVSAPEHLQPAGRKPTWAGRAKMRRGKQGGESRDPAVCSGGGREAKEGSPGPPIGVVTHSPACRGSAAVAITSLSPGLLQNRIFQLYSKNGLPLTCKELPKMMPLWVVFRYFWRDTAQTQTWSLLWSAGRGFPCLKEMKIMLLTRVSDKAFVPMWAIPLRNSRCLAGMNPCSPYQGLLPLHRQSDSGCSRREGGHRHHLWSCSCVCCRQRTSQVTPETQFQSFELTWRILPNADEAKLTQIHIGYLGGGRDTSASSRVETRWGHQSRLKLSFLS